MYCISINFKNTSSDERQKISFSATEKNKLLSRLKKEDLILGGVIVSTCNRTELYVDLVEGIKFDCIDKALSEFKNYSLERLYKYGFFFEGRSAISHLMKVCTGLDSMILGEDEIFHQVKNSYKESVKDGNSSSELNVIFQGAFNCAKIIKSNTNLSKTPVSFGTLSANEIENFYKNHVDGESYVLVIGATGKMGSIVTKNLVDKGIKVVATTRTHRTNNFTALELQQYSDDYVKMISFDDRYDYIDKAFAVVSATSSPHYVITQNEFFDSVKSNSDKLIIDLAIPYDIDRGIKNALNIEFLDIDYFKNKIKTNEAIKLNEKQNAIKIIREYLEVILKKIYVRQLLPIFKNSQDLSVKSIGWNYVRDNMNSEEMYELLSVCRNGGI